MFARCLESLERCQNLEWLNLMDWPIADCWSELLQKIIRFDDRAFSPAVPNHHLFDVLPRYSLKRLSRKKFLADLLLALLERWISPVGNRQACRVGSFSRFLKADFRISADRQLLLQFPDAVPKSPEFASRRSNFHEEATLVGDLVRLIFGLECAKAGVGQRHVRAFSQCGFAKGRKRPAKSAGTPENGRDAPRPFKGGIP
jgi:hypothetical protein